MPRDNRYFEVIVPNNHMLSFSILIYRGHFHSVCQWSRRQTKINFVSRLP